MDFFPTRFSTQFRQFGFYKRIEIGTFREPKEIPLQLHDAQMSSEVFLLSFQARSREIDNLLHTNLLLIYHRDTAKALMEIELNLIRLETERLHNKLRFEVPGSSGE